MRYLAAGLAIALVACNTSVDTPTSVKTESTSASSATAPAPTVNPIAEPAGHNGRIKNGAYSITNETGIPQFYCVAAFGVTPGGAQGAGSNIFQDQGVYNAGDVFSGQAPREADCQYDQIQVDLTQSKDCKNFDWHSVLAAEVYANPGFDVTTVTTTYTAWSEWKDSPVADTQEVCYDEYKVEQYRTRIRTDKTCLNSKDTEERETQTVIRKREKPCPVNCVGDFEFDGAKQSDACGVNSYKWDQYKFVVTTPAANGGLACKYENGYTEERNKTSWTCPPPLCYYTISGQPEGSDRQALCQQAAGVVYVNWNVSDNHCTTTLPGVYKDVIPEYTVPDPKPNDPNKTKKVNIHFNLVHGQSDDACRKGDKP